MLKNITSKYKLKIQAFKIKFVTNGRNDVSYGKEKNTNRR